MPKTVSESPPYQLSRSKRAFFQVAAVLLVLAGFELGCRVFLRAPTPRLCRVESRTYAWCQPFSELVEREGWHSPPAGSTYSHIYPDDPRGYFGPDCSVEYRINADGFRGPSRGEESQGQHRVVFLGDSFTFGEGVRVEDTFVARLASQLATRTTDGRGVQTLNLAQPGLNPYTEAKILDQVGRHAQAELVVLVLTPNDWPSELITQVHSRDVQGEYTALFGETGLYHASRLLWWIDATWRKSQLAQSQRAAFDALPAWLPRDARAQSLVSEVILGMRDVASTNSASFTIVLLPELVRLSTGEYPYAPIHDAVRDLGKSEQIQVIDLLPDFLGKQPADLWVHAVDHHPNEQAHAIIATRIARELRAPFLAAPSP